MVWRGDCKKICLNPRVRWRRFINRFHPSTTNYSYHIEDVLRWPTSKGELLLEIVHTVKVFESSLSGDFVSFKTDVAGAIVGM